MAKYLLLVLCVALGFASCMKSKESTECPYRPTDYQAPAIEQKALEAYLDSFDIEATKHPTGLYYQIITPGSSSDSLGLCSEVRIKYKGTLTNGSTFDSTDNFSWVLGALIEGWKTGVPLIRKGGRIKLYIPPSLGYGDSEQKNANGVVVIPANSILIFDIELIDYSASN